MDMHKQAKHIDIETYLIGQVIRDADVRPSGIVKLGFLEV